MPWRPWRPYEVPSLTHAALCENPQVPHGELTIPSTLLQAIAARTGRVTLVLGAGCSIEAPTNLRLSSHYAREVFDSLVSDGVIAPEDCSSPDDLSAVASAVYNKHGVQAPVVQRLPRNSFRYARANSGYLIAAALLREGSIGCVATLNYDLALTDAVRQLGGDDIDEIAGPSDMRYFGSKAIVYVHRNVNEQNDERWILRKEALEDEWRDGWEAVVAARIAAAPITVFAGLGSPAAVLSETVRRIRQAVPDAVDAFLVDPGANSPFATSLDLPPENLVRAPWGDFMTRLGDRLMDECRRALVKTCIDLCTENGWTDDPAVVAAACSAYCSEGVLRVGALRARWLCSQNPYEFDSDDRRSLIADLLLAIGLIHEDNGAPIRFSEDGLVYVKTSGGRVRTLLPISGQGHRRWSQVEALLAGQQVYRKTTPDAVVAGGFQGLSIAELTPPTDIVEGEVTDDLTQGVVRPRVVSIDTLRTDPTYPLWGQFDE